jgi:hypothetical protein
LEIVTARPRFPFSGISLIDPSVPAVRDYFVCCPGGHQLPTVKAMVEGLLSGASLARPLWPARFPIEGASIFAARGRADSQAENSRNPIALRTVARVYSAASTDR